MGKTDSLLQHIAYFQYVHFEKKYSNLFSKTIGLTT